MGGAWYCEIKINPHSGNTRLGWTTFRDNLNLPCGFSEFSFSYRDKLGTKFHKALGEAYGEAYGPGDTIGLYLYMDPGNSIPTVKEISEAYKNRGSRYYIVRQEEEVEVCDRSFVAFFKNGKSQGIAFDKLIKGRYYPTASLFGNASVTFNFGPAFEFPPEIQAMIPFKPICDLYPNPTPQSILSTADSSLASMSAAQSAALIETNFSQEIST